MNHSTAVVVEQARALQLCLRTIEEGLPEAPARAAVRSVLPHCGAENVSEGLVLVAMRRIAEQPFMPGARIASAGEGDVARTMQALVHIWTVWAGGETPKGASAVLTKLEQTKRNDRSDALEMMALRLWAGAVRALLQKDPLEARRLWCRAMDVASNFGLEAQPVVAWSYAASFLG